MTPLSRRAIALSPATVQLLRPGSSLSVLPDAEISFHMVIEDEQHGIKSVYAEYRRRDAAGGGRPRA